MLSCQPLLLSAVLPTSRLLERNSDRISLLSFIQAGAQQVEGRTIFLVSGHLSEFRFSEKIWDGGVVRRPPVSVPEYLSVVSQHRAGGGGGSGGARWEAWEWWGSGAEWECWEFSSLFFSRRPRLPRLLLVSHQPRTEGSHVNWVTAWPRGRQSGDRGVAPPPDDESGLAGLHADCGDVTQLGDPERIVSPGELWALLALTRRRVVT